MLNTSLAYSAKKFRHIFMEDKKISKNFKLKNNRRLSVIMTYEISIILLKALNSNASWYNFRIDSNLIVKL